MQSGGGAEEGGDAGGGRGGDVAPGPVVGASSELISQKVSKVVFFSQFPHKFVN
jgi:hypothetical protein